MINGLRVVSVRRRGKGLVATKQFRVGQVVGLVHGHLTDDPSDNCIEWESGLVLEPDAPFRFLNHSCDPNCELEINGRVIRVIVLRTARAGDELTIDYKWPANDAIPCKCGSKNCRGWIVRKRDLKKVKDRDLCPVA